MVPPPRDYDILHAIVSAAAKIAEA
jgi:hypothetical protein